MNCAPDSDGEEEEEDDDERTTEPYYRSDDCDNDDDEEVEGEDREAFDTQLPTRHAVSWSTVYIIKLPWYRVTIPKGKTSC